MDKQKFLPSLTKRTSFFLAWAILYVAVLPTAGAQVFPTDIYGQPTEEQIQAGDDDSRSGIDERLKRLDEENERVARQEEAEREQRAREERDRAARVREARAREAARSREARDTAQSSDQNQDVFTIGTESAIDASYYGGSIDAGSRLMDPSEHGTLWSLATEARSRYRSEAGSASIMQLVQAIYDANPNAFMGGDMNRMRADVMLTIPNLSIATRVDTGVAVAQITADAVSRNLTRSRLPVSSLPETPVSEALDPALSAVAAAAPSVRLRLTDPNAAQREDRGNDQVTRGAVNPFDSSSLDLSEGDEITAEYIEQLISEYGASSGDAATTSPVETNTPAAEVASDATANTPVPELTQSVGATANVDVFEIIEDSPDAVVISSAGLASFEDTVGEGEESFLSRYRMAVVAIFLVLLIASGSIYVSRASAARAQINLPTTPGQEVDRELHAVDKVLDALAEVFSPYVEKFRAWARQHKRHDELSELIEEEISSASAVQIARPAEVDTRADVPSSVQVSVASEKATSPADTPVVPTSGTKVTPVDKAANDTVPNSGLVQQLDAITGLLSIGEAETALEQFEALIAAEPDAATHPSTRQVFARLTMRFTTPSEQQDDVVERLDNLASQLKHAETNTAPVVEGTRINVAGGREALAQAREGKEKLVTLSPFKSQSNS